MRKPFINKKLIYSYETVLGKNTIVINEYAPLLSAYEIQLNKTDVKNFLAEIFDKNEESAI